MDAVKGNLHRCARCRVNVIAVLFLARNEIMVKIMRNTDVCISAIK